MGKKKWRVPRVEPVASPERVIVVGAGLAGLAAARTLHDAGVDVVVVEATDRLGGRATTATVDGLPIDLGAAWVHGLKHSPVAQAFTALGVPLVHDDWHHIVAHDPHGRIPDELVDDAVEWAFELVDDSEDLAEAIGGDPPVIDGIERWLDAQDLTERERDVYAVLLRLGFEHDIGGAAEEGSLWHWDAGGLPKGGDHVPIGGYAPLVHALAHGLDIRFGSAVHAVAATDDGVQVTADHGVLTGSHVLVTVPLGVLQADTIRFSPDVTPAHRSAWSRLRMGALDKVILVFDEPLTDAPTDTVLHLDPYDPGAIPVVINATATTGGTVWIGLASGDWSRLERSRMTDQELVRLTCERLRQGLGRPIPEPVATRVTRWVDDPFARGSYSFMPIGSSPDDLDACAQPVAGRILFAGEHTDSYWYQTTHGAIRSGLREAGRLGVEPVWPPVLRNG